MLKKILLMWFSITVIVSYGCEHRKPKSKEFKYLPKSLKNTDITKYYEGDLEKINFDSHEIKNIYPSEDKLLKEEISLSDFIDSVWYVKLETNNESVVKKIQNIQIHKGKIYILDSRNKSILIFSKETRCAN